MTIYGLSGKSGTGKSYHSQELCGKLGINAMIDDGLLIFDNNILAGRSAKKEATKIGAAKCAIFTDDEHCAEVRKALAENDISKILIIGTSDKMIGIIAERLGLPAPQEYIHIEDITTRLERRIASKMREDKGTHVIPVPTFEVKKQFSGYFIDPKKGLKELIGDEKNEKTVMRPTYSYLGNFEISNKAITDIVEHVAADVPGIASILWSAMENDDSGMYLRVIVLLERDAKVMSAALELQRCVTETVASMTAFNMRGVDVEIHGFKMSQ